jgi:tetratricopeptide (TPR) repeat protein
MGIRCVPRERPVRCNEANRTSRHGRVGCREGLLPLAVRWSLTRYRVLRTVRPPANITVRVVVLLIVTAILDQGPAGMARYRGRSEQASRETRTYKEILKDYRTASSDRAVESVLRWWRSHGEGAKRIFDELGIPREEHMRIPPERLVIVAAAIHAEAGATLAIRGELNAALEQFQVSYELVDLPGFSHLLTDVSRDVPRTIKLARVYVLQGGLQLDGLASNLDQLRKQFPEDADVLRASGSLEEARLLPVALGPGREGYWDTMPHTQWTSARKPPELQRAMEFYSESRAAYPSDPETLARLGRVLYLQGRFETARSTLFQALDLEASPVVRYWAFLFLGATEQAMNRSAAAADAYRGALEVVPGAQSASAGLGAQFAAAGDWPSARRLLEQSVRRSSYDPWWLYPFGQSYRLEELIRRLRVMVK